MSAQYRPYRDEESVDGLEATSWSDNEPGTIQIYEKTTEELPFNSAANKRALWIQMVILLTIGILGFLLGYFAPFHPSAMNSIINNHNGPEQFTDTQQQHHHSLENPSEANSHSDDQFHSTEDPTIKDKLLSNIDKSNILKVLTDYQDTNRIPGSETDHLFARDVQRLFKSFNMDRITATNYTFQTMLPRNGTVVKLLDKNDKVLYSNIEQEPYEHDDMRPFLPLSQANETIITTDQILYVNRGTKDDYLKLSNLGVGANETGGKILVIRQTYYQAYSTVILAQENGARAILLFPDPELYSKSSPFPKSVQLPNDAGRSHPTAWSNYGDLVDFNISLLTGIDSSKLGLDKEPKIQIPVIPISFDTAKTILRGLSGPSAPKEWNCFDFTLRIGPSYRETTTLDSREKIRIEFYNHEKQIVSTTITGTINGSIEPDRYIIVGSRRDSLNRGLLDSVSGTAVMLEIARVFGVLKMKGWRPRRTIIFNSFGAESLNLVSSSNWVEEHQRLLHSRAIAYLNCDLVVTGNSSAAIAASPLIFQVLYNATKQVENPNILEEPLQATVYDSWKESHHFTKKEEIITNLKGSDSNNKIKSDELTKILEEYDSIESKLPKSATSKDSDSEEDGFGSPGSILHEYKKSATMKTRPKVRKLDLQSIYSPFFLYAGVPVVDVRYAGFRGVKVKSDTLLEDMMPLIGTKYDNMNTLKNIDPHLNYHVAATKILIEILRDLSDSVFLPFNLIEYAVTLKDSYINFVTKYGQTFERSRIELESLKQIIANFAIAAIKFHYRQDRVNLNDAMTVRRYNDQLMQLEKAFLDSSNVPNHWDRKHIILTPNDGQEHDEGFPGLVEWITLLDGDDLDRADLAVFNEILKVHYKHVVYSISNAIKIIDEVYIL